MARREDTKTKAFGWYWASCWLVQGRHRRAGRVGMGHCCCCSAEPPVSYWPMQSTAVAAADPTKTIHCAVIVDGGGVAAAVDRDRQRSRPAAALGWRWNKPRWVGCALRKWSQCRIERGRGWRAQKVPLWGSAIEKRRTSYWCRCCCSLILWMS